MKPGHKKTRKTKNDFPPLTPMYQRLLKQDQDRRRKARENKARNTTPPPTRTLSKSTPLRKDGESKREFLLRVAKTTPKKPLPTPPKPTDTPWWRGLGRYYNQRYTPIVSTRSNNKKKLPNSITKTMKKKITKKPKKTITKKPKKTIKNNINNVIKKKTQKKNPTFLKYFKGYGTRPYHAPKRRY